MKITTYKSGNIPDDVLRSVSNLLHDSFAERRNQGINFKCGTFTPQEVNNEFSNFGGFLLVAEEYSAIIGTLSLVERRKGGIIYASHDNLAVSSLCKGKGIASHLFEQALIVAKENNWDFLTSFTATNATSSVKYHLKMGFVIYGKSYGTNYNSYSFIYPLIRMKFMRFQIIAKVVFLLNTIKSYIKKY